MKEHLMITLVALVALLGSSCASQEASSTLTPTPIGTATGTVEGLSTTAPTEIPPATETPRPSPTATTATTPTTAPTATPTPLPFDPPAGQILFFYAHNLLEEKHGELDEYNLYRANATADPSAWEITPILTQTNPLLSPDLLSPDQSKMAFLAVHDTNGDGELTGHPSRDLRDIFVYDLVSESVRQLTDVASDEVSEVSNGIVWDRDSQAILSAQSSQIRRIPLTGAPPEAIFTPADFTIGGPMAASPDRSLLIFPTHTEGSVKNDQLQALVSNAKDLIVLRSKNGSIASSAWSPNGRWWAFRDVTGRSFMIDADTLELSSLLPEEDVGDIHGWSSNGRWLSIVKNWNTLMLWHPETMTATEILAGEAIKRPLWAPDDNRIAVSVDRGEKEQLLTIDAATGAQTVLLEAGPEQTITLHSWSPDGEWLLFHLEEADSAGLFILHPDSGTMYPVMDTSGGRVSFYLVWAPAP